MTGYKPCLLCPCTVIYARGLCRPHYQKHLYRIRHGQATWRRLEADGKALPAGPCGFKKDEFYRLMKAGKQQGV